MTHERPQGFPWIIPYLTVHDPKATIAFYEKAFGFTRKEVVEMENGDVMHAEMVYKDCLVMLGPDNCPGYEQGDVQAPSKLNGTPVTLYVYTENVDELFARAVAAGAKVIEAPTDQFWGDRMCRIKDLEGHHWSFATHLGNTNAQELKSSCSQPSSCCCG